ncbi:MAG: amidohydrolase family protein [Gemmatimonadetes bacterium]|nr:amidohydrolase family protein [Gemmatimonadota bacterium]
MHRSRSPLLLGSALALLAAPGARGQDGRPERYAIVDARIVPVSGPVIERGTIVIQRGIITAVASDATAPAGAWVIDGSGLTVYPGLIDAMSSLGMPQVRDSAPPARGGDGPPGQGGGGGPFSRGPEDRPATFTWVTGADRLEPDEDAFEQWRSAGFTSVVTAPAQGFFPGQASVVNLGAGRPNDMVVHPSVALRFNLQGGPAHRGYPGSRPGVYAYLKQIFMDAGHYADASARYERDPRGRQRPGYDRALEALVPVQQGQMPLLFPATTATDIVRAQSISAQIGVRPIIYGAHRGYQIADALAGQGTPVLVSLDWPAAPPDADPEAEASLDVLRFRLLAPTTPARLQEAGVPFAFYSAGVDDPADAIAAVRKAVEAGLAPDAAVRALTLSPAEIFGVADRVGSLDVGKIANLIVTTGELLAEDTKVTMVFVDGAKFEIDTETERPEDEEDEEEEDAPQLSDTQLRERIGPSYRGPYRDDAVTVIQNATILTVTGGTIENGSIVIRDGKIAEVGTNVSVPGGAHVIDAAGKYVMPGIIDAHTHVAGGFNEGSVAVSAMTRVLDNINPDDVNIYRALAGGVTSMNVLHGSANPIGGQNAVLKLRWGTDAAGLLLEGAPSGIKFALGENPKRDRNPDRYPATRMGVNDVIRQAFVDARQYQAEWDTYQASGDQNTTPPRRDLKLEALTEILRGERLVHAHSYRGDEILQLIRLAEEFGFTIATFQHVLEGYKVAKEIAEHGAGASTFSDWWAYKVEAYDAIPYNAAIMVEKGVTVSINSDSNEEMRHLNEEAAKTMRWGGLTEDQALSLITINPARQLGVADKVGSIEVGKDADLAIFDRHPLDNFAVVQQTFVDGKLYFDIDGDRERQRAIEDEKARLTEGQRPRPRVTTKAAEGGAR